MEVQEKLQQLVREFATENSDTKTLEGKNLVDDLGYDSFSLMQLIIEIEETFGISMDEDVLIDSFDNFDSLLESVYKLVKGV